MEYPLISLFRFHLLFTWPDKQRGIYAADTTVHRANIILSITGGFLPAKSAQRYELVGHYCSFCCSHLSTGIQDRDSGQIISSTRNARKLPCAPFLHVKHANHVTISSCLERLHDQPDAVLAIQRQFAGQAYWNLGTTRGLVAIVRIIRHRLLHVATT